MNNLHVFAKHLAIVGLSCGLLACHGSEEPVDAAAVESRESRETDPQVDAGEAPADLETIRSLLQARHAEDLPSAEQLGKYPSAEASLRTLAEHGETMALRVRALALLEHFDSAATGELLTRVVTDLAAHPALRAAALTGMTGQPLDQQPARLPGVVAALRDADPRVQTAAVELLGQSEVGREALDQAVQTGALPEAVREQIEQLDSVDQLDAR